MTPRLITEGSAVHRRLQGINWTLSLIAVLVIPFLVTIPLKPSVFGNSYTIGISNINDAIAWAVAVLGLNLLIGFNGQLSLGNSFFVGTGAYLTGVFVQTYHWSFISTLLIVLPVCLAIGLIVGVPALRIQGLYLALVTFGLAAVFPSLAKIDQLARFTNGASGLSIESKLLPASWMPIQGSLDLVRKVPLLGDWTGTDSFSERQAQMVYTYFLLVIIAAACFLVVRNLIKSRPGRALIAIRDNEIGAEVSGVNLSLYKAGAFGISALLSGVAGTMLAMGKHFVSPEEMGINFAIFLIVGLIVGGAASLKGSLIGGFAVIFVTQWASQTRKVPLLGWKLSGPYGQMVLGILLIALMFVMPGGIAAGLQRARGRFYRMVPSSRADSRSESLMSES